jgi:predicted CoA-binding protein
MSPTPQDACPLPDDLPDDEDAVIRRMLAGKRIAVVGLSDDPSRPSYDVARYLQSAGKEIIPVNPNHAKVMGLKCYPSLEAVPGPVDVVDVFRRPEFCADVVRDAVAAGAKGVWLQSGIVSDEAERIANEAGIDFVQDRCLKVELMFHGR